MRRLLTGYAVTFNLRHNRSGHLFRNRYKSLVCDEDAYLLELVRYIHLNPVRVGMASDLDALERFPWTGHAVLMGRRARSMQLSAGTPKGSTFRHRPWHPDHDTHAFSMRGPLSATLRSMQATRARKFPDTFR